ncbi:MAG: IclR family transcriptional regulator [Pseudomonadota bacterium]|mgnify:CR=1 FL=1
MKSNQANSAAIRAFRILEILAESRRPLSLADIVDAIELPKPTVHRILQQLQESWLIARSVGSRHYECSSRVNRFSLNLMMNSGPAAERHAILRDLVEQIGETCNLTMLNGTEIVYIDRVETQWPLRVHLQPGSTVPLHCTATGKLLLSLLPKGKRDKLLDTLPLRAVAGNTITDRTALRREIEETRRRRIGINNQENLLGIIAVAVPVMLDRNRACAAIAAQAPVVRMSLDQLLGYVPAMRQAAEAIVETFPRTK